MKYLVLTAAGVFFLTALFPSVSTAQGYNPVGYFYSALDPHGEWIVIDDGYYAWRPWRAGRMWRPYTVGYWVWTDMGWYWHSTEPWGWATYHYGRWFYDPWYGWLWVPGLDWAPAWVEWRYGGPTIGWAPLPPYAVYDPYGGIRYRSAWRTPDEYWIFTDAGRMTSPQLQHHIYRSSSNSRYVGSTRRGGSVESRGGRLVSRGPEREYVEREGRVRIPPATVIESRTPGTQRVGSRGSDRTVEIYRPSPQEMSRAGAPREPRNATRPERPVEIRTQETDMRMRPATPERPAGGGRQPGRTEELWRESHEVPPPLREPPAERPAPPVQGMRRDVRPADQPTAPAGSPGRPQEMRQGPERSAPARPAEQQRSSDTGRSRPPRENR